MLFRQHPHLHRRHDRPYAGNDRTGGLCLCAPAVLRYVTISGAAERTGSALDAVHDAVLLGKRDIVRLYGARDLRRIETHRTRPQARSAGDTRMRRILEHALFGEQRET